jgi:hypothetical protein
MRASIVLSFLFGLGGVAAAERPAHDQACECSCAETPPVPGRSSVPPSRSTPRHGGIRGTDIETPLSDEPWSPRPIPREDRDEPHPFDTPSTPSPSTPGVPTPTPWRE